MYMLDTNVCIKLMSGDPDIRHRITMIKSSAINICVIVAGELLYGAYKSSRINENLNIVNILLDAMRNIYSVDTETMNIYGQLKAKLTERFSPKDGTNTKLRKFKIETLGFTDNDLWIASISIQHNLILMSADKGLMRLNGMEGLRIENW